MNNCIKAILVDDEASARENLGMLLERFCPEINIIGEATNVDDAMQLIQNSTLGVVFLDVEMPGKSGFDLINAIDRVDFQVIFVTAYDQYALKAFEVSAIDYLLKPIAVDRLQEAIRKLMIHKEQQTYKTRFETLKTNTHDQTLKKLAIPQGNDYAVVNIDDIIAIEADRMYSKLSVTDPQTRVVKKYTYSKKLSYFENLFEHLSELHRVHRSWMVNTRYMTSYSKKDHTIILKNTIIVPVSKSYKSTFEASLGF